MYIKTAIIALACASLSSFAEQPQCSDEALQQAKALMTFHADGFDDDKYAAIDQATLSQLPSLAIPDNEAPQFIVLQVMGHIYKSTYQINLTYYSDGCILMGQEIRELATP